MNLNDVKIELKNVARNYFGFDGFSYEDVERVCNYIDDNGSRIERDLLKFNGKSYDGFGGLRDLDYIFSNCRKKINIIKKQPNGKKELYIYDLQRYGVYSNTIISFVGEIFLEFYGTRISWE